MEREREMCSAELGTGSSGAFTFFAREHGAEECDSHGLPLTPNTILITGLFQQLKEMPHPFLCEYLDLMKCDSGTHRILLTTPLNYPL